MGKKINQTKPFLPPYEEYCQLIKIIYKNEWLTNRGEMVNELEKRIQQHLTSIARPIVMNNGTIPIQIALKLFGGRGEIITTPFSYVATTSSIVWENCTPVFVDIDPIHWTIDASKIEKAITKRTTCILATHVFGNVCEVEKIEKIAKAYKLKVIYDAAHCFGVTYKGQSIFNWGDVSTCSFHATKIFHTIEGGAAFVNSDQYYNTIFQMHNFGHSGPDNFIEVGINGKLSEFHSAMGLVNLKYFNDILIKRKKIFESYKEFFSETVVFMKIRDEVEWNYHYFPILLKDENQLIKVKNSLEKNNIQSRRYFFPSLNKLSYLKVQSEQLISEDISSRILCLPMNYDLTVNEIEKISNLVIQNLGE